MSEWDRAKERLARAIQLGLDTEKEDPNLAVPDLTPKQVDWLAAWLAGEGFDV